MDFTLNLTEEQEQRIAKAQTPEEKARILAEIAEVAHGSVELSEQDLEAVSGGHHAVQKRKTERQKLLEIYYEVLNVYGPEIAQITAEEMGLTL